LATVFKKWYGWYFYRNRAHQWVIDPTHEREYVNDSSLLVFLNKYDLVIVENKKSLHWFPLTDFILKRIGLKQKVYENSFILKFLRKIKIPIPGYYNWEIICLKK